jgi:hypothetical protein
MDEIHKMPGWKTWLKGVVDGRAAQQALLVTGSARMDTFRQSGESLAGRYFSWRLHPVSVREWCAHSGAVPAAALAHLMRRGGFPEPCLAASDEDAARWRNQYATDLVREDVLEFSRLHEITALRLFLDMLRQRVGAPLSLASIARDLAVAPNTLKRYLDILQALFIVFTVQPWHRNVGRALLQAPKVYFYDTGMVADNARRAVGKRRGGDAAEARAVPPRRSRHRGWPALHPHQGWRRSRFRPQRERRADPPHRMQARRQQSAQAPAALRHPVRRHRGRTTGRRAATGGESRPGVDPPRR